MQRNTFAFAIFAIMLRRTSARPAHPSPVKIAVRGGPQKPLPLKRKSRPIGRKKKTKMNQQKISSHHRTDENGNPAGGHTDSLGLQIRWQNGALAVDGKQIEPNGCFVETVIRAAIDRLEYYQSTKFQCEQNRAAIANLYSSLHNLNQRTKERKAKGIEGTHKVE